MKTRRTSAWRRCDGRWFGGKRVDACLWDGVTNYAKAGVRDDETEAEQSARLEKFAADLERA